MVPSVRSFGRSRCTAPSRTACRSPSASSAVEPAGLGDGLAEVNEHDDPGRGRHAEAGDVADPDGHRELEAEEPLEEHAAGDGARDGQHHQRGVGQVVIGPVEDQEDQGEHERHDHAQGRRGAGLVLELAGPFEERPFRELDLARDNLAGRRATKSAAFASRTFSRT